MTTFPVFARIRAERAAREQRGVVLPFSPTVRREIAAENVTATAWQSLWDDWLNAWGDVYRETIAMARDTALAALDNCVIDYSIIRQLRLERMICDRMEIIAHQQERNRQTVRRAEVEHSGRLIREILRSTEMDEKEHDSVEFTEEENKAIAEIGLNVLRNVLPGHQFQAISKLINCIAACVNLNEGTKRQ